MKKLKLNLTGIGEKLNNEQMKKIIGGGYDDCPPGPCDYTMYICPVDNIFCSGGVQYVCQGTPCDCPTC